MGLGNVILQKKLTQATYTDPELFTGIDVANSALSFLKRGRVPVLPIFEDTYGPFLFTSTVTRAESLYGCLHEVTLPIDGGHIMTTISLRLRMNADQYRAVGANLPEYVYSYINYISIYIDDLELERLHGHTLFLFHTLLASTAQKQLLEQMCICRNNDSLDIVLPIPFSWSENTSSFLPLFALPKTSTIRFVVAMQPSQLLQDIMGLPLMQFDLFEVYVRYLNLSSTELDRFKCTLETSHLDVYLQPFQYMLDGELPQTQTSIKTRLPFSGRISELFWMVESTYQAATGTFNYWRDGNVLCDHVWRARLLHDNEEQDNALPGVYFRTMDTFQVHRGQGLQTWRQVADERQNTLPALRRRIGSGIYCKRFAPYPEYTSIQPNGFLYADVIGRLELELTLYASTRPRSLHVFARSLRTLRFSKNCSPKFVN